MSTKAVKITFEDAQTIIGQIAKDRPDLAIRFVDQWTPEGNDHRDRLLRYMPPTVPRQVHGGMMRLDGPKLDGLHWTPVIADPGAIQLPADVAASVAEFLEEHSKRELLARHGLAPRHRVLLQGPPGCGKTHLARMIANKLDLPLGEIRSESLVGSHMGATGARLIKIEEAMRARQTGMVLFFDECEGLLMDRHGSAGHHDVTEILRVTSQFLGFIDRLPASVIFIAATNAADMMDPAILRRFDLSARIPLPDYASRVVLWSSILAGHLAVPQTAADATKGWSVVRILDAGRDLRRRHVLSGLPITDDVVAVRVAGAA